MAITSLDQALSGEKPMEFYAKAASGITVVGRPWTPFYAAGIPGAAVAPTPGMSGAALTSYAGQIPIPPASGNTHISTAWFSSNPPGGASQGGMVLLCDRLWHNSGINVTLTTAQTVNSVTFPARDIDGTTNGEGVYIGVEVSGATGAGTPTLTMSYTNQAGTAGRTATNIEATAATSSVGTFYRMGLQAGDTGVQSVQSFTLSATWTSGTIHLVAYRVIAPIPLVAAGVPGSINLVTGNMPRVYDNSVLFPLYLPASTASTFISGAVKFTQG